MDEILDIFKNDAFTATSLDRVAKALPYIPSYLGSLGLFDPKPIRTTTVSVWTQSGVLQMVPTSERGSPDPLITRAQSDLRQLSTLRLAQRDRVQAAEIQNLIAMPLGSASQLRGMAEEIAERGATLRQNNEYTQENHRLGALQGKILDADGVTVVKNFWTEFGVTEPAEIFFDFANIAAGALQQFIEDNITRPMVRALGNRANPGTRIHALVGDSFWSSLINHPDVRTLLQLQGLAGNQSIAMLLLQSRTGQQQPPFGQFNRNGTWGTFDFGGVTWINYMGTLNNEIAIGTTKARFFPVGATDVFRVYWSPGERAVDVNTLGQPAYLIVQPDVRDQMREYFDLYFRNYPLYACIFPQGLLKGRSA